MKRIVFVVGAGASVSYGPFPVGSGLAASIEAQMADELSARDGPIINALSRTGFGTAQSQAMERIARGLSARESIDQFIDDCKDGAIERVAKLAISLFILRAEASSKLNRPRGLSAERTLRTIRDTWLGIICRHGRPAANSQDFTARLRDISFVTFNYDRCIEKFLLTWAQESLNKSENDIAKLVAKVPVIHAFGQVGHLTSLSFQSNNEIPFGSDNDQFLDRASKEIQTFTEELRSGHAAKVRDELAAADVIVFLGFHYHEQNMRILFGDKMPNGKTIFGTTLGMSVRSTDRLVHAFREQGSVTFLQAAECDTFMASNYEEIFDL